MKKEIARLQGVWAFVGDGSGTPPRSEDGILIIQIMGDRIVASRFFVEGDQLVKKDEEELGRFTLDPARKPKSIDLTMSSGPNKGKLARGLYQVDGDALALVLPTDPEGARPAQLARSPDAFVMLFKRPSLDPDKNPRLDPPTKASRPKTAKSAKAPPAKPAAATTAAPAEDDDAGFAQGMLLVLVVGSAVLLLLAGAALWLLRRGDRAVRARVAQARAGQFNLPPAEDAAEPPAES
jgi:uncharacterized protein (TIGR03067 family)